MKRKNPRLILQYLSHGPTNALADDFRGLWSPSLDRKVGDHLNITSLHNYGGGRAYNPLADKIASVCFYPWRVMSVLRDGRVVTCCMDYNDAQVMGDLTCQTVVNTWNEPVVSSIRRKFGRLEYGEFPTCMCCDWVHRRQADGKKIAVTRKCV
jgi:hypothetical protein